MRCHRRGISARVVVVPARLRGRDAVFGERVRLVVPEPVRAGISGAQRIAGSVSATAPGVSCGSGIDGAVPGALRLGGASAAQEGGRGKLRLARNTVDPRHTGSSAL